MLSTGGIIAVGCYLLSLLLIGAFARRASREASLRDYYLAGGSLGVISLFFTLYATQYSGNTLSGVPGLAYREGVAAFVVALAVMAIVLVYTTFAPALHEIGRRQRCVTAGDFIRWRFDDPRLLLAANLVFVLTLTGYILANLKALGLLVEGATGGTITAAQGILLLSLIMAIYESLGGMRSVVWTDVIQGSILLGGCLLVFLVVWQRPDMGIVSLDELAVSARATFGSFEQSAASVSLLLIVAIGAAVYPQAIQRIYAARDAATLRRSYTVLAFMPLLVMMPLLLIAMSSARWLPGLSVTESERVILHTIEVAFAGSAAWSGMLALFIGAALAAIMSTIDSALLALGSIVSNDVFGADRDARDEVRLHRLSRMLTWLLMSVLAVLAIVLPQSIWALMVLKFELLVQVAPTIILGVRMPRLRSTSLLAGIVTGAATAMILKVVPGLDNALGINAGLWGLLTNLLTIAVAERLVRRSAPA